MYRLLLLGLALCHWTTLPAQEDSNIPTFTQTHQLDFSTAYHGEMIWNPGLKFGAEYLLGQKVKAKRSHKSKTKQWLLGGNLGLNWDPRSHVALWTDYGILYRRTKNPKGRQINFKINPLGYYRSFLPQTYEVVDDEVNKVVLAGRNYYAPSIAFGIGRFRENKKRKAWFLNLNLRVLMPYNSGVLPMIAIDYGYRFRFSNDKNTKRG